MADLLTKPKTSARADRNPATRCRIIPPDVVGDWLSSLAKGRNRKLAAQEAPPSQMTAPMLMSRTDNRKRIKGLCGAKPPQKPGWTDAGSFGGSTLYYGDFTADVRCRGGWCASAVSFRGAATALLAVQTVVPGWPASSLGSR